MAFSFDAQQEYHDQTFKRLNYAGRPVSGINFENCLFTGCTFTKTAFTDCKFRECVFKECDLRLAELRGSTFLNTQFEQSNAAGIDWTISGWPKGGLFTPVLFTACDISFSVFVGLNLRKVRIVRCVAKGANFTEADLTQADCTYTDFTESRFWHTNLTEANLSYATSYDIAASVNKLKKTKFSLPDAVRLLNDLDIILVGTQADS
jgi:fluoroquinolone resistance protein